MTHVEDAVVDRPAFELLQGVCAYEPPRGHSIDAVPRSFNHRVNRAERAAGCSGKIVLRMTMVEEAEERHQCIVLWRHVGGVAGGGTSRTASHIRRIALVKLWPRYSGLHIGSRS